MEQDRAGRGNNGEVTPEGKWEGSELSGQAPGCRLGALVPFSSQVFGSQYTGS